MTLTLESHPIHHATPRSWKQAMWRGFTCSCPACGKGRMFGKYLKVADTCPSCGEELHHHRADDAPPYFTMMIVGHVVVPLVLVVEKIWHPISYLLFPLSGAAFIADAFPPSIREIVLLVRPGRRSTVEQRVAREILKNDAFDRLQARVSGALAAELGHGA